MESAFGQKQRMIQALEEIIHAHNLAATYEDKIQILSIIVDNTPFSVLNEYNPIEVRKKIREENGYEEDDTSMVAQEENLDHMTDKSLEMSLNSAINSEVNSSSKKKVYFNPPCTHHKYRKARFHNRMSGAGRPYIKEKSIRWKLSTEIMEIIVDFLTSTQQMQSVAHGTLKITLDSGKKTRISGVIRRNSQAQCVRQIKALLHELGMKVPSDRTLRRIIKNLPAKRSRLITGIGKSIFLVENFTMRWPSSKVS